MSTKPVQIGNATLYLGDCLEVLPTLQKVDAVWVDPPYNVGKDYGGHNDSMAEPDYFAWCESWIAALRQLSDRISIYPPKKHLRWFWDRLPECDLVVCPWRPAGAVRGKRIHQFAPLLCGAPQRKGPDVLFDPQVPGLGYFFREDTYGHPGYTSLDITSRVMEVHTNRGETVLDCFMGTGTTGVAAMNKGRNFVGVELTPKHFDTACVRIEEAQKQAALFPHEEVVRPTQMEIES